MRRNVLVVAALMALIAGGFLLGACSVLEPDQQRPSTGDAEPTAQTDGVGEETRANGMGGMNGMGQMGGMGAPKGVPRVPPVKAYYDGEEVYFIHTETSDEETADLLTNMMGSPVLVVPELGEVSDEALLKVYVFANGVKGDGPLGFQPDVFDPAPGDEGYSPLRQLYLVTWKDGSQPRELRSLQEVQDAEEKGAVEIEQREVVINEPFLTWPGGKR